MSRLLTLECVAQPWPALGAWHWSFWCKLRHSLAVAVFAFVGYAMWTWNVIGWKG